MRSGTSATTRATLLGTQPTELAAPRLRAPPVLDHLDAQINALPEPRSVEILLDGELGNVGEKRQRILERARGHFVCVVDDDDWVAHDYIEHMVNTVAHNPNVDCVSLTGVMTTDGLKPERFDHSLKYREWRSTEELHERNPNHINPVRRELALKVGFKPLAYAEDHDFSQRLLPLLKTEASPGEAPLYYYWFKTRK